jgi:hypothetical protein
MKEVSTSSQAGQEYFAAETDHRIGSCPSPCPGWRGVCATSLVGHFKISVDLPRANYLPPQRPEVVQFYIGLTKKFYPRPSVRGQ